MKCELLAEENLALMLDFIDDENTKYDEAVLKAFINEKNASKAINRSTELNAIDENKKLLKFVHDDVRQCAAT